MLAVDIPSGVDGLTGEAAAGGAPPTPRSPSPRSSPACCSNPGRRSPAMVEVADIGLDVGSARTHLRDRADVAAWWPPARAPRTSGSAVWVVAGSPGMRGARPLRARRRTGRRRLRAPVQPGRARRLDVRSRWCRNTLHRSASDWPAPWCRRARPVRGAGHRQRPGHRRRHPATRLGAAGSTRWPSSRRWSTPTGSRAGRDAALVGPHDGAHPPRRRVRPVRRRRPGATASPRPADWPSSWVAWCCSRAGDRGGGPGGRRGWWPPATPGWPPPAPATSWPGSSGPWPRGLDPWRAAAGRRVPARPRRPL